MPRRSMWRTRRVVQKILDRKCQVLNSLASAILKAKKSKEFIRDGLFFERFR
jgi:hypothetical protein